MNNSGLSLGLGLCIFALGCAGGKNPPAEAAGSLTNDPALASEPGNADPNASDAAVSDAEPTPDAGARAEDTVPPVVDPAVAHALVAKSGEGSAAALGLRF